MLFKKLIKMIRLVPKAYVSGFAFSSDFKVVTLIKKQKPLWQLGLLNAVNGRVCPGEFSLTAMCRKFFEETGAQTYLDQWKPLEVFIDEKIEISYFYCVLEDNQKPLTVTDEQIFNVYWQNYNHLDWQRLGVVSSVPYLIQKAFCELTQSQKDKILLESKVEEN